VVLGAGTLYGALNSLMKKNWIELYSEEISSRKKKQYIITDLGRQAFEREVIRLKELINCSKLMEDLND
jgi:DNA-binding PadR family transcriptional regulator